MTSIIHDKVINATLYCNLPVGEIVGYLVGEKVGLNVGSAAR